MTQRTIINRYDHGGARVYIQGDDGSRDLVADIYGDADRREQIIAAMFLNGIIPPLGSRTDGEAASK